MTANAKFPADGPREDSTALEDAQRAALNILEDFDAERRQQEYVQRATINVLEDFDAERAGLERGQRATLNLLEDFDAEKVRLEGTQHALLNILDDIDVEKAKVAAINSQLETANKELEAFSYSVSHDLRAPLRHMHGFAKILLEDFGPSLDPSARHYLHRIYEATQHMGRLVDDLLNLSRVGRQALHLERTGLNALVEEVLTDLQGETRGRQVDWRVGSLPTVECDPNLIKQVFTNLLSNALKYTRPRERAVIEIGQMAADGRGALFVRDNGVGFDMKYADKLFGVFQRLHAQDDFEGTGVGLALVQRIVRKHGGEVWAEAELDKGATFYFTLGALRLAPEIDSRDLGGANWALTR